MSGKDSDYVIVVPNVPPGLAPNIEEGHILNTMATSNKNNLDTDEKSNKGLFTSVSDNKLIIAIIVIVIIIIAIVAYVIYKKPSNKQESQKDSPKNLKDKTHAGSSQAAKPQQKAKLQPTNQQSTEQQSATSQQKMSRTSVNKDDLENFVRRDTSVKRNTMTPFNEDVMYENDGNDEEDGYEEHEEYEEEYNNAGEDEYNNTDEDESDKNANVKEISAQHSSQNIKQPQNKVSKMTEEVKKLCEKPLKNGGYCKNKASTNGTCRIHSK